nr:hypothetical transcript [Hymenolepis microstoma]
MKLEKIFILLVGVLTINICFVESRRLYEISREELEDAPYLEELSRFWRKFNHETKRFAVANAWDDFEDYRKRSGYLHSC